MDPNRDAKEAEERERVRESCGEEYAEYWESERREERKEKRQWEDNNLPE